ncbi:hypothetical protein H312_02420 [Anncaliia algerae PRA339]|uniref:Uncharacterized protein n=1 Tax=Anncaliia algerae PRA339 TaxID=1288291 RepID=A0A059EZL2_9MICR|nr:hypothetical protein H312_02420 [Anncaliia algerae PRA339]
MTKGPLKERRKDFLIEIIFFDEFKENTYGKMLFYQKLN